MKNGYFLPGHFPSMIFSPCHVLAALMFLQGKKKKMVFSLVWVGSLGSTRLGAVFFFIAAGFKITSPLRLLSWFLPYSPALEWSVLKGPNNSVHTPM